MDCPWPRGVKASLLGGPLAPGLRGTCHLPWCCRLTRSLHLTSTLPIWADPLLDNLTAASRCFGMGRQPAEGLGEGRNTSHIWGPMRSCVQTFPPSLADASTIRGVSMRAWTPGDCNLKAPMAHVWPRASCCFSILEGAVTCARLLCHNLPFVGKMQSFQIIFSGHILCHL